ncbi:MAG: hypothetical protein K8R90_09290 [Candidatus Cloacimonetes bacterium]|nr:hypothetical protein [Candidatus Cloacimonadota bacterium]
MRTLFFALIAGIFLGACGNPPDVLVVGAVEKQIGAFPLEFALNTGILSADHFQIRRFSSEVRLATALAEGRVDAAMLPFLHFAGVDAPVKLFSSMQREGGGIVCEASEFADTRGYHVGVHTGCMVPMLSVLVTDSLRLGWELTEYDDREDMANALQTGEMQALADAVPYLLGYGDENDGILWFSEVLPGYPAADLLATNHAIEHKRALLDEAVEAAIAAASFINAYPNEANDRFLTIYPFSRRAIRKTLTRTWYYTAIDEQSRAFRHRAAAMLGTNTDSLYITP